MDIRRYTTRDEAIEREIIEALDEWVDEFDIDAIADEVLGDWEDGFAVMVDHDTFSAILEKHALSADDIASKAESLAHGDTDADLERAAHLWARAAEIIMSDVEEGGIAPDVAAGRAALWTEKAAWARAQQD